MNSKALSNYLPTDDDNSKHYILSPYQKQDFSLPEPIVFYIIKNVSSATVYQKLIMCCKYCFEKNSIFCVHCLSYCYYDGIWECCLKMGENSCVKRDGSACWPNRKTLNFNSQKIWVTNHLQIISTKYIKQLSFPKNIMFNLIKFHIINQKISLRQIAIIGSSVKMAYFGNVIVTDDEEHEVSLTKIIENLPFLEEFKFEKKLNYTSKIIVEELLKCPKFRTLKRFYVSNIAENFDVIKLYDLIKENTTIDIHLEFNYGLSEIFRLNLNTVTQNILKLKNIWAPALYISSNTLPFLEAPINKRHKSDAEKRSHLCYLYRLKFPF